MKIQEQQVYRSNKSNSCWLIRKVEHGQVTMEELNNLIHKNIVTRPLHEVELAIAAGHMERRRASIHETDI